MGYLVTLHKIAEAYANVCNIMSICCCTLAYVIGTLGIHHIWYGYTIIRSHSALNMLFEKGFVHVQNVLHIGTYQKYIGDTLMIHYLDIDLA